MWNTIIAAVTALIFGIVITFGWSWKHEIELAAKYAAEKAQLEQTIKDQQEAIVRSKKVEEDQNKIIKEVQEANNDLESKLNGLDDYLNSEQATKDSIKECVNAESKDLNSKNKSKKIVHEHGSSEVLKRTIRELSRYSK